MNVFERFRVAFYRVFQNVRTWAFTWDISFSNFSCRFLNSNYFFHSNFSNVLDLRNLQEQAKKHSVSKTVLNDLSLFTVQIHCSSDLKLLWKFLAFSLEFQKKFSITRTFFSHSESEQFWKQNTVSHYLTQKNHSKYFLNFFVNVKSVLKFRLST